MKKILLSVVVIVFVFIGLYFLIKPSNNTNTTNSTNNANTTGNIEIPVEYFDIVSFDFVPLIEFRNQYKIKSITELDKLFAKENIYSEGKESTYNSLINQKEKLIEHFNIDNNFFKNYYLALTSYVPDSITYNKSQNELVFNEKIDYEITPDVFMGYTLIFIKIDKEYDANIVHNAQY